MKLPTEKTKKNTDLSNQIIFLYGQPKIGKSTFCSQFPDAIFLSTEDGLKAMEAYQIMISSWEEFSEAAGLLAKGEHQFRTIVIDTVDNLYTMCQNYICKKHKIDHPGDMGFGKGFALLNAEFSRLLTKLSLLTYGLVFIGHSKQVVNETRTGQKTKEVPTLPEGARKILLGMADVILFAEVSQGKDAAGVLHTDHVLRCKPSENYEAGDRTGLINADTIPLDYEVFSRLFVQKGDKK